MPKEDVLMRQISELGFALRRLMERMKGGKGGGGGISQSSLADNVALKEELGLDWQEFLDLDADQLIPFLLENPGFSAENMELFADYLVQTGKESYHKQNLYAKALLIYTHVDKETATFSMERSGKIQRIKQESAS